jgi:hypothetical protein
LLNFEFLDLNDEGDGAMNANPYQSPRAIQSPGAFASLWRRHFCWWAAMDGLLIAFIVCGALSVVTCADLLFSQGVWLRSLPRMQAPLSIVFLLSTFGYFVVIPFIVAASYMVRRFDCPRCGEKFYKGRGRRYLLYSGSCSSCGLPKWQTYG